MNAAQPGSAPPRRTRTFVDSSGRIYPISSPAKGASAAKQGNSKEQQQYASSRRQDTRRQDSYLRPALTLSTAPVHHAWQQSKALQILVSPLPECESPQVMDMTPDHFDCTSPRPERSAAAPARRDSSLLSTSTQSMVTAYDDIELLSRAETAAESANHSPHHDRTSQSKAGEAARRDSSLLSGSQQSMVTANDHAGLLPRADTAAEDRVDHPCYDLTYKSKPAEAVVCKVHELCYSSQHTRPLSEVFQELLQRCLLTPASESQPLLGNSKSRQRQRWWACLFCCSCRNRKPSTLPSPSRHYSPIQEAQACTASRHEPIDPIIVEETVRNDAHLDVHNTLLGLPKKGSSEIPAALSRTSRPT